MRPPFSCSPVHQRPRIHTLQISIPPTETIEVAKLLHNPISPEDCTLTLFQTLSCHDSATATSSGHSKPSATTPVPDPCPQLALATCLPSVKCIWLPRDHPVSDPSKRDRTPCSSPTPTPPTPPISPAPITAADSHDNVRPPSLKWCRVNVVANSPALQPISYSQFPHCLGLRSPPTLPCPPHQQRACFGMPRTSAPALVHWKAHSVVYTSS